MDSKTYLTKTLAAGAVLMKRPNLMLRSESQKEPEEAYLDLKRMIQDKYKQVDVNILDRGPGSAEGQRAMAEQLEEAGVTEDEEILHQAKIAMDLIREEEPSTLWASEPAKTPAHLQ